MNLKAPSKTPLDKPENITNLEHQLQLNLNPDQAGQKSIEWAAGLFEGEGCISHFNKNVKRNDPWHLKVKMTDEDVLQDFFKIVGCGKLYGPYHPPSMKPHHKTYWTYMLYKTSDVLRVLRLLLPYLGKRRAAKAREVIKDLSPDEIIN